MAQAARNAAARTYVDFEPLHRLVEEPVKKTITVHLSTEFKREQIRVHVDNPGRLRIIGERPLKGNQWSRFRLELPIPEGCNADGIHAKFEKDGDLHIIMPMLSPAGEPKAPDAKTGDDASQDQKAAGHGSAQQTIAAEAEQEKKHQEEDARKCPDQNEEHTSEADGGRGETVARLLPAGVPKAPGAKTGNDASQDQKAAGHDSSRQAAAAEAEQEKQRPEEEDARKRPDQEEHMSEADGGRGEAVAKLSPAGEPKAPDAKTGDDASQDQKAAGHGSAHQTIAAEAEQEKKRQEEDARKRPDQNEEHTSEADGGRGEEVARLSPAGERKAPDAKTGDDASQDLKAAGHSSAQQIIAAEAKQEKKRQEEDARKRPDQNEEHMSEADGGRGEAMVRLSPAGEPKAPGVKTGNDASQDQKVAGHGSSRQAAAAEAEQEKQRPEEEDARKRPDQEEHKSEGDGGRGEAVATPTTRPACGELRDRRKVVWTLLLAVVLALVGAALYAKYRLMDPSAEPAPADDGIIGLSDY